MSTNIHPTAIVDPKAKLGENVVVGPYAIIEGDVEIGDNGQIGPHACVYNGARVGKNVKILQSAAVSNVPQDLKYDNEETYFYVGDNCVIREYVTLHRGTKETGYSKIGNNCLIMAYAHIAHDCVLGDNCIVSNAVQVAGHINIEDFVIIGGGALIHQFSKIGKHAMVGGGCMIRQDVPPYVIIGSDPTRYAGLNVVGLRRRGFSNDDISAIKEAYTVIYNSNLNVSEAKKILQDDMSDNEFVKSIIDFIDGSNRGIIKK